MKLAQITCTAAGLALLAPAAIAHVTVVAEKSAPGATTKLTLRVPHGCDGEATEEIRVELPEGVYAAKPMPHAGWEIDTETGAYATPYDNHGTEMTEGVRSITWSGGSLPDDFYDEFSFRAALGAELAPGAVLYMPTVQTCATGEEAWTDTSGGHDGKPAPALTLAEAPTAPAHGHDHGHNHGHTHDHAAQDHAAHDHGSDGHAMQAQAAGATADVTLGDLTLSSAFTRATLPNAPVGGGFLTVTNDGDTDDRLIAATSPAAGRVEIHEMDMDGDVMRMRELADGLPIPAGDTVALQPGGYHLMLMELAAPLVEGETVDVTLTFETAGEVTLPLAIGAPNATGAGHEGMH
ncbi:DUF1775 domain-containing protein [Mesobaculum littorinae]|uniref:DUF1775 domain-containing protein n=1 Tax=Mesobaculum littorinae TaxID=2486419 RepID=A0A438AH92_9RHOB|nr:DUF1775 domain-containing protein [Mesobaculum littorinae]RVV98091.1 DUF1775 domain-containing protein [Mesobaculum littorinae]